MSARFTSALTLSWFDANTGKYASTQSDPVALAVRTAKRVGAADVVSSASETEADTASPSTSPVTGSPGTSTATSAGTLTAAEFSDLSIETRASQLTGASSLPGGSWWFHAIAYAGALALLFGSSAMRRRRETDPALRARTTLVTNARATVAKAASVADVSQTVRQLVAALGAGAMRDEVDGLLADCDAAEYSRSALDPEALAALRERAQRLIQQWHTP